MLADNLKDLVGSDTLEKERLDFINILKDWYKKNPKEVTDFMKCYITIDSKGKIMIVKEK